MRNYLILYFLLFHSIAYSQNNNSTQSTNNQFVGSRSAMDLANDAAKEQGVYPIGNGKYKVVKVGGSGFVSLSTLKKRAEKQIIFFTEKNYLTYKLLNLEEQKSTIGVFPKVVATYQLYDSTGKIYLTNEEKVTARESSIRELKQLKELLDLGLISRDDFEKKSAPLRKILLDQLN